MNKTLRNLTIVSLGLFFLTSCQTSGSLSEANRPTPIKLSTRKSEETKQIKETDKKIEKAEKVEKPKEVKKVEKAEKIKVNNIFFGYKQTSVNTEYKKMLKNVLGKIKDKTSAKLLLCGHTDERGSKQYNIILGQKRAYSVKRFLISLGFSKENIQIKSYGETKTIASGNNEKAWKQNRRVEIKIK